MSNTPNFATPPFTVPADGSTQIAFVGNYLTNLTSSMLAGTLTVTIGDGRASRFDAGDTYVLPPGTSFDKITLNNTTGSAVSVTLGMAVGEIKVSNAVSVSGTVAVTFTPGTTLVDGADVAVAATTAVKIITGTATDKTKFISNLLANGTVVRWGTSAAGAARGPELGIGSGLSLDLGAADLWVYNPTGNIINIGWAVVRA